MENKKPTQKEMWFLMTGIEPVIADRLVKLYDKERLLLTQKYPPENTIEKKELLN